VHRSAIKGGLTALTAVALSLVGTGCGLLKPKENPNFAHVEADLETQATNLGGEGTADVSLHSSEEQSIHLERVISAVDLHRHDYSEKVIYVIEGSGMLNLAGRSREINAGDVIVVPMSVRHGITPQGEEPVILVTLYTPALKVGDTVYGE
jgi:mannose-6-phosphate isomerase-like protein (cupin superfamily)